MRPRLCEQFRQKMENNYTSIMQGVDQVLQSQDRFEPSPRRVIQTPNHDTSRFSSLNSNRRRRSYFEQRNLFSPCRTNLSRTTRDSQFASISDRRKSMGSNVQKFNRAVLTLPMNLSKDHIHCCKSTYPIDQATEG